LFFFALSLRNFIFDDINKTFQEQYFINYRKTKISFVTFSHDPIVRILLSNRFPIVLPILPQY
jgi:hypothetical protein